jgi:hypothetical protein
LLAQVAEGSVQFGVGGSAESRIRSIQSWPLQGGIYKAYLLRNTEQPYTVVAASPSFLVHRIEAEKVAAAESDIRSLVASDRPLGPKFVRLGFHDCVGSCDGCVDMTNPDNIGLEGPIQALEAVVAKHENLSIKFSRADIWALAALIGADMAQGGEDRVDFSMEWIGRRNCEDQGECLDAHSTVRACSPDLGPHRELPPPHMTTADLFHFFSQDFGFDERETVALMGAHTLGGLSADNSGFNGVNGWVRDNTVLDNDYYFELVGGTSLDSSLEDLIEDAPPWTRVVESNSDLDGMPDRPAWEAFPRSEDFPEGERILMLNADVSGCVEKLESFVGEIGLARCENLVSYLFLFLLVDCPCSRVG